MFNKPSVFTRNDPITRRDVQPVLGQGSKSAAIPAAIPNAATVRNAAGNQAPTPATSKPETAATSPASAALTPAGAAATGENVLEARLIVGPDVKLKGAEILDCDTLVVEGRVEATMDSRVIRIAEKGYFAGKVSIDIAEIHGAFEGELTARSQLIIHSTGRVSGTIRFGKLVVDEGGELCGDVNVISVNTSTQHKPAAEPFVTLSAVVA